MAYTRAGHYLYEASTRPLPGKEEYIGNKAVKRKCTKNISSVPSMKRFYHFLKGGLSKYILLKIHTEEWVEGGARILPGSNVICKCEIYEPSETSTLKVHKIENFFGSYFEFCVISLLVMLKY